MYWYYHLQGEKTFFFFHAIYKNYKNLLLNQLQICKSSPATATPPLCTYSFLIFSKTRINFFLTQLKLKKSDLYEPLNDLYEHLCVNARPIYLQQICFWSCLPPESSFWQWDHIFQPCPDWRCHQTHHKRKDVLQEPQHQRHYGAKNYVGHK